MKTYLMRTKMVYYQAHYHAICNDIVEVKYYLIISYILSSPLLKKKKKIKAPLQVKGRFEPVFSAPQAHSYDPKCWPKRF